MSFQQAVAELYKAVNRGEVHIHQLTPQGRQALAQYAVQQGIPARRAQIEFKAQYPGPTPFRAQPVTPEGRMWLTGAGGRLPADQAVSPAPRPAQIFGEQVYSSFMGMTGSPIPTMTQPETTGEKIAAGAGQMVGITPLYMGLGATIAPAAGAVAGGLAARGAGPLVQRMGARAMQLGAISGIRGAMEAGAQGMSARETVSHIGKEALSGAAYGAAFGAASYGIQALRQVLIRRGFTELEKMFEKQGYQRVGPRHWRDPRGEDIVVVGNEVYSGEELRSGMSLTSTGSWKRIDPSVMSRPEVKQAMQNLGAGPKSTVEAPTGAPTMQHEKWGQVKVIGETPSMWKVQDAKGNIHYMKKSLMLGTGEQAAAQPGQAPPGAAPATEAAKNIRNPMAPPTEKQITAINTIASKIKKVDPSFDKKAWLQQAIGVTSTKDIANRGQAGQVIDALNAYLNNAASKGKQAAQGVPPAQGFTPAQEAATAKVIAYMKRYPQVAQEYAAAIDSGVKPAKIEESIAGLAEVKNFQDVLWRNVLAEARAMSQQQGVTATTPGLKLPKDLAGAKPRYSYGNKQFSLEFESDIDKALYIVAQASPSRRDADYMAFLKEAFPGAKAPDLRTAGRELKAFIKTLAQEASPGVLKVPAQTPRINLGGAPSQDATAKAIAVMQSRPELAQGLTSSFAQYRPRAQAIIAQAVGVDETAIDWDVAYREAEKIAAGAPTIDELADQETAGLRLVKSGKGLRSKPRIVPPLAQGARAVVRTEKGTKVETVYALVEADAVIASHGAGLKPDPRYAIKALQPRQRGERMALSTQVREIMGKLDPELLGENPVASLGAPIVGPDMLVESGNGRVIALKGLYDQNHPNAQVYRQWLLQNAERFGLQPQAVQEAQKPVLVRIRQTPVDRARFAEEANVPPTAAMSATEQAIADAKKLKGALLDTFIPSETGEIATAANREFIRNFMGHVVGTTEQGRYMTPEGGLSQEGIVRIRNAIFAKAYGDTAAIERLAESTDSNVRNITNGMLIAAPRLAKIREAIQAGRLYDLDITSDIAQAMQKLAALREAGQTVQMYLMQQQLFGEDLSPFGKAVLSEFDKYSRSAKKVAELLLTYADAVEKAGDPKQVTMFAQGPPAKDDVLAAAIKAMEVKYGAAQPEQLGFFDVQSGGGGLFGGPGAGTPSSGSLFAIHPFFRPRETFTPITDIGAGQGSLTSDEMAKLPSRLRHKIEAIDAKATATNQAVKELLVKNYAKQLHEIPEADQEKARKLLDELARLEEQRLALKEEVDTLLGKAAVGEFPEAESLKKIDEAALKQAWRLTEMTDPETGEVIGYQYFVPLGQKPLVIPRFAQPTLEDEAVLSKPMNIVAAAVWPMRDVFTEPVARLVRNAEKIYRGSVLEYESRLHERARQLGITRGSDEDYRFALMLEGKMPIQGKEGELAKWVRKHILGEKPGDALHGVFGFSKDQWHDFYLSRVPEMLARKEITPESIPEEIRFFAENPRFGELDPRERSGIAILETYIRAGFKKLAFQPVLEQADSYLKTMSPDRKKAFEIVMDAALGRPTLEERIMNETIKAAANTLFKAVGIKQELKGRPAMVASAFIANLEYLSGLGLSPFSIMKNLTQKWLIVATLDKNPIVGMEYLMKAWAAKASGEAKKHLKHCWVLDDRQYLEGINAEHRLLERIFGPAREFLLKGYRWSDRSNVEDAFMAKLMRELDRGIPYAEAVDRANVYAGDTQFLYGIDSPLMYKGPLGRQFGVFQSWSMNYMRLLYKLGTRGEKEKIVSIVLGYIALAYLLRKITGLDFSSITPSNTMGKWLPFNILGGEQAPMARHVSAAYRWAGAWLEGDLRALEEAKEDYKKSLVAFVPGGGQARRVGGFLDAAMNDWRLYDERSRLRYEVTPWEAFKGLLGPTVESRGRYQQYQNIAYTRNLYQQLRAQAIDAVLQGDYDGFMRAQMQIVQMGGNPITSADIKRELQLRQMTGLQRYQMGLPQGMPIQEAPDYSRILRGEL